MPEVEIPQSWREIGSYMMYEDLSAYPSLEAGIMDVLDSWFSEGDRQCVLAFLILLGERNLTPEEMAAVWNAAEIPVVVMSSTGGIADYLDQRMVALIRLAALQRE